MNNTSNTDKLSDSFFNKLIVAHNYYLRSVKTGDTPEPKAKELSFGDLKWFQGNPQEILFRVIKYVVGSDTLDERKLRLALMLTCKDMFNLISWPMLTWCTYVDMLQAISEGEWFNAYAHCTDLLSKKIDEREEVTASHISFLLSQPVVIDYELHQGHGDFTGIHRTFLQQVRAKDPNLKISLEVVNLILMRIMDVTYDNRYYWLELIAICFQFGYVNNDFIMQTTFVKDLMGKLQNEDQQIMFEGCQMLNALVDPTQYFEGTGYQYYRVLNNWLANKTITNALINIIKISFKADNYQLLQLAYQVLCLSVVFGSFPDECASLMFNFVKEQMQENDSFPFINSEFENKYDLEYIINLCLGKLFELKCSALEKDNLCSGLIRRSCQEIMRLRRGDKTHLFIIMILDFISGLIKVSKKSISNIEELLAYVKTLKETLPYHEKQKVNQCIWRLSSSFDETDVNEEAARGLLDHIIDFLLDNSDNKNQPIQFIKMLIENDLLEQNEHKERILNGIAQIVSEQIVPVPEDEVTDLKRPVDPLVLSIYDFFDTLVAKKWATDEEINERFPLFAIENSD